MKTREVKIINKGLEDEMVNITSHLKAVVSRNQFIYCVAQCIVSVFSFFSENNLQISSSCSNSVMCGFSFPV